MTNIIYCFTRDAAGDYTPVKLEVLKVTRDESGKGTVDVKLSYGEQVSLTTEFDPGQLIAGATFYATIETGNRLVEVPWRQVYAQPAYS
ncbi:MAG: hypothetical protein RBG13Loki_1541, partial [Promethearchaeota archaeon CR_4]